MLLAPLGDFCSRVQSALGADFGHVVLSFSLFHMTNFDLQIDFRSAAIARMIKPSEWLSCSFPQHGGFMPFCLGEEQCRFRPDEPGRNYWGSVGISLVTTMLIGVPSSQQRFDEPYFRIDPALRTMIQGATQAMQASWCDAAHATNSLRFGTGNRSTTGHMLSYPLDAFRFLADSTFWPWFHGLSMKKSSRGRIAVHRRRQCSELLL